MMTLHEDSPCYDIVTNEASDPEERWTDQDLLNSLSHDGIDVGSDGSSICEDGDIMTVGQLLRAADFHAIAQAAEDAGGNRMCDWYDTMMQWSPTNSFFFFNCPTEEGIAAAKQDALASDLTLLRHNGGLKKSVRDTGGKLAVQIKYSNGLARFPPWPLSQVEDMKYAITAALIHTDPEKTSETELVSRTDWVEKYYPEAITCPDPPSPDDPGCQVYTLNETMVERQGLIITFGQQGTIGSTNNWLTLLVGAYTTIIVLTGRVGGWIHKVATVRTLARCHVPFVCALWHRLLQSLLLMLPPRLSFSRLALTSSRVEMFSPGSA